MKEKNGQLTDHDIKKSVFYSLIEERYNQFSYNNLTTVNYTDAIVDFNAKLAHSLLKSDYILYEEKATNEYNHMGIALGTTDDNGYIETFFHEKTDKYIVGQKIVKIIKFTIYKSDGSVLVEDTF